MRRRNGNGSQQLVDVTEKFRKGELKLIRIMEEEGLISDRERTSLSQQVDRSVAQKRSSEVLAAAHTVHNKLIRVLQNAKAAGARRDPSEIDILMELSRLIQTTIDSKSVFERVLDLIARVVPYEHATLFFLPRREKCLQPAAIRGTQVDLISGVQFDLGPGFSSWVAKQKKPILLNDLHPVGRVDRPDMGSFLSVPMVVQGELIGVLNLSHAANGAFSDDHLRLLTLISAQAAAVLQRVLMYEEMRQLAETDELTGVTNRRKFVERLEEEICRSERYQTCFSILFLDIDNLKLINDSWGHALGDRILVEMGKLLPRLSRSSDIIARYGGDEFVVLLPMTNGDQAMIAADRLRTRIQGHSFPRRKRLTVSLGVASFPADGATSETLMQSADTALYTAKKLGRNRTVQSGLAAA